MPKTNPSVIALMSAAPIVLSLLTTVAFAQNNQEAVVVKALEVIDAAFKCTPPVTTETFYEKAIQSSYSILASMDEDFLRLRVDKYDQDKNQKLGFYTLGSYSQYYYWARLGDLSFSKFKKSGHTYLKAQCSNADQCISEKYSRRGSDDKYGIRASRSARKVNSIEILSCDDKSAQALLVGYAHLAKLSASRTPPDIAEWESVRNVDDHLIVRRYLKKFQSSPLAAQASNRLAELERANGPASSYEEFITPEAEVYRAPKKIAFYPGPQEFFEPAGHFEIDEKIVSKGRIGDADVDWVVVTRSGVDRFVPRQNVLSEGAYSELVRLRQERSEYENMLQQMKKAHGKFAAHAGIYDLSCTRKWFDTIGKKAANEMLLRRFIFWTEGSRGVIAQFAWSPSQRREFTLKPSREVVMSGSTGRKRMRLYSATYTKGSDFKEIGFGEDEITISAGEGRRFTSLKKCAHDEDVFVRNALDDRIENLKENIK